MRCHAFSILCLKEHVVIVVPSIEKYMYDGMWLRAACTCDQSVLNSVSFVKCYCKEKARKGANLRFEVWGYRQIIFNHLGAECYSESYDEVHTVKFYHDQPMTCVSFSSLACTIAIKTHPVEPKRWRRRCKCWLETHFKYSITESGPKSQCSDAISFKDPVCKIWRHRMVRKCIATSINVISCLPSFDDGRVESPKLLSWYTFWTTADKWLHINVVFSQAKLPFI